MDCNRLEKSRRHETHFVLWKRPKQLQLTRLSKRKLFCTKNPGQDFIPWKYLCSAAMEKRCVKFQLSLISTRRQTTFDHFSEPFDGNLFILEHWTGCKPQSSVRGEPYFVRNGEGQMVVHTSRKRRRKEDGVLQWNQVLKHFVF